MKIFIQKSINSIFINIFSIQFTTTIFSRYFVKNFFSRKVSKKKSAKRAISSKIEFSRSTLPSFQGSFDLGNFQFQLGREKIRKDWKKVSYALGIQLARFPPPISSPRNGYRARQFAKQPRRSISSTRSVATRDPESSTNGLFEGGNCSKHVPLARSNFLSNARPTPRGERSQEGWDEAAITRFVIRARLSKNVFA